MKEHKQLPRQPKPNNQPEENLPEGYLDFMNLLESAYQSGDPMKAASIIRDTIIEKSELSKEDKQLFSDVYEYAEKCALQNKPFETNLLRIFLKDVKGYEKLENLRILPVIVLVNMCGFKMEIPEILETFSDNPAITIKP